MSPKFQIRARRAGLGLCLLAVAALAACTGAPLPEAASRGVGGDYAHAPARQVELLSLANLPPQAIEQPGGAYRLGVGDVVQLHVVDEPDLTLPSGYPVEPDGAIAVPFLGRVPAAERSAEDLRADLAERLRAFHAAPQVFVRITGFHARHVSIVGAVRQPGRHSLTDQPLSVIDAINASGGFLDPARVPDVTILRAGAAVAVDIDGFLARGASLPALRDGDVVQVAPRALRAAAPAAGFSLTLGGITRRYPLHDAVTLASVTAQAAPRGQDTVYLLREEGTRLLAMAGSPAEAMDPHIGGRRVLRPGDRVVVLDGSVVTPHDHLARLTPVLNTLPRE